jgi:Lrp/AsnC family transcriptional regulator for asnA, asnC and gidA
MKIDDVDLGILKLLEENGRTPNNVIAKKLALSEGTVRNRIKKLSDNQLLKVKGLTNPNVRTDKQLIYILAKIPLHKEWDATAKKIALIPEVKAVSMLTGRFDALIEVFIEPYKLFQFLNEKMSEIPNVVSTESMIAVRTYRKWV